MLISKPNNRLCIVAFAISLLIATIVNGQPAFLFENWESYSNGATPYGDWRLEKGEWGEISDIGLDGRKCYFVGAGKKSRIQRAIDLSSCSDIVIQGWMYDSGEGVNRTLLGLNDAANSTGNCLIRVGVGTPNYRTYTVVFSDFLQSEKQIAVDTELPFEKGWHFMRLDISHDRTVTFRVWNTLQSIEKTGHFVWVFDKTKLNYVTIGSNVTTPESVGWDDIKVGSLEKVGPPPVLPNGKSQIVIAKEEKPVSKNQGLQVWLQFSDESGNTAKDSSPNDLAAFLRNGAAISEVDGRPHCLDLDGKEGYLEFPPAFDDFTQGMTVAFWARPTSETKWARFIDFGNGEKHDNIVIARQLTNANLAFVVYSGVGGQAPPKRVVATNVLELSKWQYFAAVMDSSGRAKLYKNGAVVAEGEVFVPRPVQRANNFVGKSNFHDDTPYAGQIDELRVYNRPLRDDEIAELFKSSAESAPAKEAEKTKPNP